MTRPRVERLPSTVTLTLFEAAKSGRLGDFRWFRYVRHEDRAQAESEGWQFAADLGPHHGAYSILMELIDE